MAGRAVYFLPVLQEEIKPKPDPADSAAPRAQVVRDKKSVTGPRAVGQADPEAKAATEGFFEGKETFVAAGNRR